MHRQTAEMKPRRPPSPNSTSNQPLLQSPTPQIRDNRDGKAHVYPHIPALLTEMGCDRHHLPRLRHAGHPASQIPGQQTDHGGSADREQGWGIPHGEVVPGPATEEAVLEQEDDGEGDGPVAQ